MHTLKKLIWVVLVCMAGASHSEPLRHIYVAVNAEMAFEPDMAFIKLQAQSLEANGQLAKVSVDKKVNTLLSALEQLGVDKAHISASQVRIAPQYDYRDGKSLIGYQADRDIVIELKQIDKLNAVLDQSLRASIDSIQHIELSLSDSDQAEQQVYMKAVEKAKHKAHMLARSFNQKLGAVLEIKAGQTHPVGKAMVRNRMSPQEMSFADNAGQYIQQSIRLSVSLEASFFLID